MRSTQEKYPKSVCQLFHKNSGKKFQIGSVILMAQMTNQKKTELIDYFDIVWTKNPQILESFGKWKPFFLKTAIKIVFWRPPVRHKTSEKGTTFSSKIPERVDVETIKWHAPLRKYHEFPRECN